MKQALSDNRTQHTPQLDLTIDASPVRCPFCHEGIAIAEESWVACATCLARHHNACWGEAGSVCGGCGGAEALTRERPAAPTRPSRLPLVERNERVAGDSRLLNGPREQTLEAVFQGELELTALGPWLEAELERLRLKGTANPWGKRLLQWRPNPELKTPTQLLHRQTRVVLQRKSGQTRVQVKEHYEGLYGNAFGIAGAAGFLVGFLAVVKLGELVPSLLALSIPLLVAWLLVVGLAVRSAFIPWALEQRRARQRDLLDALVLKLALPRTDSKPAG